MIHFGIHCIVYEAHVNVYLTLDMSPKCVIVPTLAVADIHILGVAKEKTQRKLLKLSILMCLAATLIYVQHVKESRL